MVWLALALTVFVYSTGLRGPFLFDDYQNLVLPLETGINSVRTLWEYASGGVSGPLGRPLTLLTFAANAWLSGLDTFWFKSTNLGIHLVNGVLVHWLAMRLQRAIPRQRHAGTLEPRTVAALVAAAWLLHPLQLSSVLYVVQRMTSLSSLFCLLGIHAYFTARDRQGGRAPSAGRFWLWIATPLCLVLAMLAKESGVLLMAYLAVIELTVLRFRAGAGRHDLGLFHGLLLLLPVLGGAMYLATHLEWLQAGEAYRGYSAGQRLLTEARVICFYLRMLLAPDLGALGLFHDDFAISRSWLSPSTTLPAVLAWLMICAAFIAVRRRLPWIAFAIGWFLAGHALESTIVMLEPVQLHRNYLAIFGPLFTAALSIGELPPRWHRRALLAAGAWLLSLSAVTALRAYQWRDAFSMAFFEVVHHPGSPRANYEVGRLLGNAARDKGSVDMLGEAARYLWRAAALNPRDMTALAALLMVGEAPDAERAYQQLRERLASRPLHATDIPFLKQLVECSGKKLCNIPSGYVFGLFDVILSREQSAEERADALSMLALYHANPHNDVASTVRLMREAATLQPNAPVYRLNLANALLLLPDYDAAEAELDIADKLDVWQKNQLRSRQLRADLARFRAAAKAPEN